MIHKKNDSNAEKKLSRRDVFKVTGAVVGASVLGGTGFYYGSYNWDFKKANDDFKYFLENGHFPALDEFKPPVTQDYNLDITQADNDAVQKALANAESQKNKYNPNMKIDVPSEYLGVDNGNDPISTNIQGLVMPGSYEQRTDTSANAPWSISIPEYGIWAGLVPMGAINGEIQIANSGEATWYNESAPIGSDAGTTIIAGHVNYANAAPTVFWNLGTVQAGSVIYLTGDDGVAHTYIAESVAQYNKHNLPSSLFTLEGAPMVAIMTCTNLSYDNSTGLWGFPDNVVLMARKV